MVKISSFPYTLCRPRASPKTPKAIWPMIIPIYSNELGQREEYMRIIAVAHLKAPLNRVTLHSWNSVVCISKVEIANHRHNKPNGDVQVAIAKQTNPSNAEKLQVAPGAVGLCFIDG